MNARTLLPMAVLAGLHAAQAQDQVAVTPLITPPYSAHVSDYQGLLVVSLTNTTEAPLDLKLIGTLTGDNGLSGRTKSTYAPPSPIHLGPFETRVLQANSQAMGFIDRNNFDINAPQQVKDAVMHTGVLPEGNYELCVRAVDHATGAPYSPEAPLGCVFFPITYAQPPTLTFPWCDGTVANPWPVFTWTPPIGSINLANTRYDLYILELLPGQNASAALNLAMDGVAGNPIVRKDLMVPSYPWQPSDPTLKANTLYAVGVVARDITHTALFENKGRSEACTFLIQETPPDTGASTTTMTMPSGPMLPIGPIADTRIKGRLVHRFKESGRAACGEADGPLMLTFTPLLNLSSMAGSGSAQPLQMAGGGPASGTQAAFHPGAPFFGAFSYPGGTGGTGYGLWQNGPFWGNVFLPQQPVDVLPTEKWKDPFPVPTEGAKPLKNIPIRLVERTVLYGAVRRDNNWKVTATADRVVLGLDWSITGPLEDEQGSNPWASGQVIATGTTDGNGAFELFYHQPNYTGLTQQGGTLGIRNLFYDHPGIPSHTPKYDGSIEASSYQKVLMLEVGSPYYCSPDLEIYAQPGDVVELPVQACYVRSYDLKVIVAQGACDYQMGGVGSPMGNVQVAVMRPADHVQSDIPEDEGQDLDGSEAVPGLGQVPLVARCATKTADGSATFHNLVQHQAYTPDEYLLKCSTDKERGLYTYQTWTQACPKTNSGVPNLPSDGYLRNSQFEVPLHEVPVAMVPLPPRVMGRVMASTTQPLPNALVTLHLKYDASAGSVKPVIAGCSQNTGSADFRSLEFQRLTDANGFFDFSNILVKGSADGMFFLGPHAWITVTRPGYKPARRPLPAGSNEKGIPPGQFNNSDPANPKVDLKMGLQWDMNSGILMEPYGLVKGTIRDEDGKPVKCDVQVGDGPWVRSETSFGPAPSSGGSGAQPGGQAGNAGSWIIQWPISIGQTGDQAQAAPATGTGTQILSAGSWGNLHMPGWTYAPMQAVERFEAPAPNGTQPVKLVPLSDQYFPLTVTRTVPAGSGSQPTELGTFTVKEKRHRLRVELTSFEGPVAGATVRLDDRVKVSDQAGVAFFEFVSPESEFRLRVDPPGDLMPVDRIIVNQVSPEPVTLKQDIEIGVSLSGRVEAVPGHAPVAGARVWVEIGSDQYGPQLNQVTTGADGSFVLHGVPLGPFTVHAAKHDGQVSHIGTAQDVNYIMVPGPPPDFKMKPTLPHVTLELQRVDDLDLTTIHGFPVEVTARKKNSDGSSTISGAFVQVPGNANFTLGNPAQRILFSNIKVNPGAPNAQGVPRAVPTSDPVVTDMANVPLRLYANFDVTLRGMPVLWLPGRVQVRAAGGAGEMRGTVSTELSSFNFSYDFNGRFHLGDGPEQPLVTAFTSGAPMPQREYNLMTLAPKGMAWSPSNAQFSLRGFPARSDRERSKVGPDAFRIATVIQVKDVPDITPAMLELNVGDIRVTPTTIEGIQGGGEKLSFQLNDWSFNATAPWTFDNNLAAIIINKGVLDMKVVKADMSQIMIRPNGLEMKAANLGEVRLGGVAPLVPEPGVHWEFGYDPGFLYQGMTGAWRFGVLTPGNATVATIQGPPELSPSKVAFSGFSLVSRGGLPLIEARALNYRYHNIMDMVPVGSMQMAPDGVDLLMNCSLAIHGLPQTTGFFSFYKEGGQVKSRLKPLGATITTGRGNVYFKLDDRMASQVIKPGQFTCYGRFRIDPDDGASGDPVYAYGFLDHKAGSTYIDLIRVDAQHYKGTQRQAIAFGGSPDKKMLLNSGKQTMGANQWNELSFKGNLVNLDGIADNPGNELAFTVKGAVALDQGKLAMDQLQTPFGDMAMSYDFEHARLVGSLDLSHNNFGAVNIVSAQLGLLADKGGFLVSCYDAHVIVPPAPWPLQDHHPALLIGAHDHIPDTLLANMMAPFRLKSLPAHMAGGKIRGLYVQDKLSLVDFSVPSTNLLLLGVEGHASCKVEGRNWVDLSGGLGFGGMAYADAGLSFWLLSPIPDCSSLDLSASASALFETSLQGGTFHVDACGSTGASASICGVGDSFTLTVKAGIDSGGGFSLSRTDGSCGQ